jgi:hypothetical protein
VKFTLSAGRIMRKATSGISRATHFFTLDVATLLLNPSQLYWERLPTNLYEFLFAYPGRATYRFDIRIDAESARQRIVPVEFIFDPTSSDLEYVRLNTRYPWWRLLRWLRSRRLH